MKSLKDLNQILQNAVVYGGLLAALNLSCGDGSDGSGNPAPNGNSADAGYSNEGGEGSEGGEGGYLPPPRKDAGLDYDANEGGEGEDVGEGGENLPPVVIIETKDEAGNVTDTFEVGKPVVLDLNKSYDPDCDTSNSCGQSKGMDYCEWSDSRGNKGFIQFPPGTNKHSYGLPKEQITTIIKCYELNKEGLSSTAEKAVTIE